jgi:hypothetical protein
MTILRLSPSTAAHHLIATTAQGPRIIATAPTYDVALAVYHELEGQERPTVIRALSVRSADDPRYRLPLTGRYPTDAEKTYVRQAERLIRDAVSAELRATARSLAKTHQGMRERGLDVSPSRVALAVKAQIGIGRVPGTRIAYWWPRRQTTLRDARTPEGQRLDQTTLALQATFRRLPA